MKVIEAIWFTEFGSTRPIGVVKCRTEWDEIIWFIGKPPGGTDEATDAEHIMKFGARFHPGLMANFLHLNA